MERHPDRIGDGVVRANGSVTPLNAGDAVAIVIDWFRAKGIPVTRQSKGMVARQAKTLLEDGFDFDTVVMSAILAIRRGGPHLMHFIASDLVAAKAGEWIADRNEYRKKLEDEIELRREAIDKALGEHPEFLS